MARKKKKTGSRKPLRHSPQASVQLEEFLENASELLVANRYAAALPVLEEADRHFPNNREVQHMLVVAASKLGDSSRALVAAEKLARLGSHDPDIQPIRGLTLLGNGFPILGHQVLRDFLQRHPDHDLAAEVRMQLPAIEQVVAACLREVEAEHPQAEALARLHEQVQVEMAVGRFGEARRLAESLILRWPSFAAARNNLAEACFHDGRMAEAVRVARQTVEVAPENSHARANLVRLLFLSGEHIEARSLARSLPAMPLSKPDDLAKVAEALSLLGEDQAVVDSWEAGKKDLQQMMPGTSAVTQHLAAVAMYRLGKEKQAQQVWKECLRRVSGFGLAADNLADGKKPVAERHAPWPFDLNAWVPQAIWEQLKRQMKKDPEDMQEALDRFLKANPQLRVIVSALLDRGDPIGRELALRLALIDPGEEMKMALRDFALGQRGPDRMRTLACVEARRVGLVSADPVRFWQNGQWVETAFPGFAITSEPILYAKHPPRVERICGEAMALMGEGDPVRAEELYRQALALAPGARDIIYNLATARVMQGHVNEFLTTIRDLNVQHPDYLFPAVQLAQMAVNNWNLKRAEELLEPARQRPVLHETELRLLANVQVDLCLARKDRAGARVWMNLLEQVIPADPLLERIRRRVKGFWSWLLGR